MSKLSSDIQKLYSGEKAKAKSPAEKFYPTGIECKNEGCENIGVGDEYCSTACAKEDNGVITTTQFQEPLFSRSRLGKPRSQTLGSYTKAA